MAGAQCAIFSFLTAPTKTSAPAGIKPILLASISTPLPSKLTKRRNSLRPKILKTLTKPYPASSLLLLELPTNPIIVSPEAPSQNDVVMETPSDKPGAIVIVGDDKVENFQVSESLGAAAECNAGVGKFSASSVLKFGFYLVGIFVFQTVCAVFILGNSNYDQRGKNSGNWNLGFNGNGRFFGRKFGKIASNVECLDETELEERIGEIRAMARKARKREDKEVKEKELNDGVEYGDIEKEVDAKLIKLQKKLNSTGTLQGLNVKYSDKSRKVEGRGSKDSLDVKKEVERALMFKKKMKFKSRLTEPLNNPKGFNGLEDHSVTKKKKSGSGGVDTMVSNEKLGNIGRELLDQDNRQDLPNVGPQGSVSETLEEDDGGSKTVSEEPKLANDVKKLKKRTGRRKAGRETRGAKTEPRTGIVQETSYRKAPFEMVKPRESSNLDAQNSRKFSQKRMEIITNFNKPAGFSANSSSRGRNFGSKMAVNKVRDKPVDRKTEFWWLNLPYVLAIRMHRGSDHEGPGGFFTLKTPSHEHEQFYSSYTLTFEDRGDANNFCYLLESFFEDLGDFSADIITLSIKELHKAVKSCAMKVIVVKKGQLQLYAGQPFADVEMALHSLVVRNQSTYTANSE